MRRERLDVWVSALLAVLVAAAALAADLFTTLPAWSISLLAAVVIVGVVAWTGRRWGPIARAVARRLGGTCECATDIAGGVDHVVRATVDGLSVRLTFSAHDATLRAQVDVPGGDLPDLRVEARDLRLDETVRALAHGDPLYDVTRGAKLAQSHEVARALDALSRLGWVEVAMVGGGLSASAPLTTVGPWAPSLWPRGVERAMRTLAELARACSRRLVEGERLRFAWTPAGGDVRCPYCHDALDPAGSELADCERCATLHHAACFAEAGGCTVFGCRVRGAAARDKTA